MCSWRWQFAQRGDCGGVVCATWIRLGNAVAAVVEACGKLVGTRRARHADARHSLGSGQVLLRRVRRGQHLPAPVHGADGVYDVAGDVNYKGLAAYYPGGWFWLGGRFANLLGRDGWAAYKPYSITWSALAAVVAFTLWSLVLHRKLALLAAVATVLGGFIAFALDEPYAWPASAWFPPIALVAWRVLRQRGRVPAWLVGLIGIYFGFSAITYTLDLVFGVVILVVLATLAGLLDARAGESLGLIVRRLLARLVMIGVIASALGLLTWAPFIVAGGLSKPSSAAHFLPEIGAYFPTPFIPNSVFGVLCPSRAGVVAGSGGPRLHSGRAAGRQRRRGGTACYRRGGVCLVRIIDAGYRRAHDLAGFPIRRHGRRCVRYRRRVRDD
jgi:hypothetical protein